MFREAWVQVFGQAQSLGKMERMWAESQEGLQERGGRRKTMAGKYVPVGG